ncbi:tRNA pseudouridine(55) synthase TruB [Oceanicoccus sagamiensis]|uniref:tRNA pseudouridine synthase B n=1 Tax=Oceanicoccus sagamiensis TaxID=716816 RepID=A0A1X9N4C2_9GAMM|nr:tRNA pseudouridine(55) synthase TruB [Oceanicoccus sagamiensis]ARN73000.1 tRNA pseudouridine(55) synthase TruB [Oceanicoccus sagamiensis]
MAKKRRGRPVDGVLIVDKPTGQSSNRSLQIAKRLFFAQKAGHTGSLDPLATGVLPVCFGEATKFSQFLLDSDKAYRSTFLFGVITASGDADGDVLEQRDATAVREACVLALLPKFLGEIEQIPSMFSALKHQGQPLYKLARQGLEVERKVRQVTIFDIRLDAFRSAEETGGQPEADVYIHCSKGTYVRSIAEDLGLELGCGAHVKKLHRVQAGPFAEAQAVSIAKLEALAEKVEVEGYDALDALLEPADAAVMHLSEVTLAESAVFYMLRGHAVSVAVIPANCEPGDIVRMYSESRDFIGIGEVLDGGQVGPKRLIATN